MHLEFYGQRLQEIQILYSICDDWCSLHLHYTCICTCISSGLILSIWIGIQTLLLLKILWKWCSCCFYSPCEPWWLVTKKKVFNMVSFRTHYKETCDYIPHSILKKTKILGGKSRVCKQIYHNSCSSILFLNFFTFVLIYL